MRARGVKTKEKEKSERRQGEKKTNRDAEQGKIEKTEFVFD